MIITDGGSVKLPPERAGQPRWRKRWYTTGQAAKLLGCSSRTVLRLCTQGKIPGLRMANGCAWKIPAEWVDAKLAPLEPAPEKAGRRKGR